MKPRKYLSIKGEPRWQFQIFIGRDSITGKQINRKRKGFKTKQEALIAYAQLLEQRENNTFIDKSKITVHQLFESWWPTYISGLEPSTISKVESYFKLHILPTTNKLKVSEITPQSIQRVINLWALEAKSGLVWGRYFKRLITYAYFNDLIISNPFDKVSTPKVVNNTRARKHEVFLNSEQLGRFLKYWQSQETKKYAYFRLMAYTGMRRGEMLALEWTDINFRKKSVSITKAIGLDYRGGKTLMYVKEPKASSRRVLSLDTHTLSILKQLKELSDDDKKVIWPGIHTYMDFNVPERWLQKFRKSEDVDQDLKQVTLHGLRHTHATVLFEQAALKGAVVPLKAVQKRLGHANIEMTLNIYTHVTDNENNLITDVLEKGLT